MTEIAPYLVAFFAMSFSAGAALTLIHFFSHLDPPEAEATAEPRETAAAA
jgi:hypothetical protein